MPVKIMNSQDNVK